MTKEEKSTELQYRNLVFYAKSRVEELQGFFYRIMLSSLGCKVNESSLDRLTHAIDALDDFERHLKDLFVEVRNDKD